MKKEHDEIVDLFRSRLSQAEMPVRADSWEQLNKGIALAANHRRNLFMRFASAAAVLLILVASSATIWLLSPRQEMEEAFTQLVNVNPGNINKDVAYSNFTPHSPVAQVVKPQYAKVASVIDNGTDAEEDFFSLSFSYTITTVEEDVYSNESPSNGYWLVGSNSNNPSTTNSNSNQIAQTSKKDNKWGIKLLGGISLPDKYSNNKLPCNIGVTVERQLNKIFSVETGLQYSHSATPESNLHYIGIPLKLNATYLKSKKIDLYATVGGVADKCIAGAPNNDFKNEPIQLGVTAGLGAQYKINDQLAAFIEPGVSHYFKTDSKLETIRSKRPTNFNVLCGLRMSF